MKLLELYTREAFVGQLERVMIGTVLKRVCRDGFGGQSPLRILPPKYSIIYNKLMYGAPRLV